MTSGGWKAAGSDDWLAEVERTLRGRDLADLISTTRDGLEIQALYTQSPDRPAAVGAAAPEDRRARGWDIRQRHRVTATDSDLRGRASRYANPAHTGEAVARAARERSEQERETPPSNATGLRLPALALRATQHEIEQDLAGGVASVELDVPAGVDVDALDAVLQGVDMASTPVALAPHADVAVAEALVAVAERRGGMLAPGSSLGLDPVGEWARAGRLADLAHAAGWAAQAAESGSASPGVRVFAVDAVRYADAGATEAQTLGWATATGVAYLRALVGAGIPVDAASGLIGFCLPANADQFVTIAALRAARVMWARVVTASGGSQEAARQYQHAVTAIHTYSRRDPWVNLLRGSVAALAAGVAGADAVTVLPFDHVSGTVDSDGTLGRRLARNTQLLLLEESHLARSSDPAGGSFYVESLTEELASGGWRVLQEVEASGGIEAAIDSGVLAAAIDESWWSRLGALRTRSEPLTGVSEFPLLDEPAPRILADPDATPPGAGLPIRRLAEPFEDLRDAADRHRMATGERPAVCVAALGSASDHSARTAWAQNLLAAGGVEARGAAGVDSPIAAAADFAASGLTVAVITGGDDMYRLRAASTAAALADAGAALVVLVCDPDTPDDLLAELRSAGVDEIWHDGIDVVAALQRLHTILGVAGASQQGD